jgi:hypothetical protein
VHLKRRRKPHASSGSMMRGQGVVRIKLPQGSPSSPVAMAETRLSLFCASTLRCSLSCASSWFRRLGPACCCDLLETVRARLAQECLCLSIDIIVLVLHLVKAHPAARV